MLFLITAAGLLAPALFVRGADWRASGGQAASEFATRHFGRFDRCRTFPLLQALSRFRVVDLTQVRAGPTAARQLADWGADVIQVQMPEHMRGDDTLGGQEGSDYQYTHRNKRSITLNLKEPEGIAVLKKLVETADVLLENFRPDVKTASASTTRRSRRSIRGSCTRASPGFGQTGPYATRPGFDQIAQGMGGLMSVTGLPGQGPAARRHSDRRSVRRNLRRVWRDCGAARARAFRQGPMAAHLAAGSDDLHDGFPDLALDDRRRNPGAGRQLPPHQHSHRRIQDE